MNGGWKDGKSQVDVRLVVYGPVPCRAQGAREAVTLRNVLRLAFLLIVPYACNLDSGLSDLQNMSRCIGADEMG